MKQLGIETEKSPGLELGSICLDSLEIPREFVATGLEKFLLETDESFNDAYAVGVRLEDI